MKRSKRRVIAQDTLAILEQGFYENQHQKQVSLKKEQAYALAQTHLYTPDELEVLVLKPLPSPKSTTLFEVNGKTTFDSVRDELQQNEDVLCLNFASARNPGGGFLNGSQAQEESIARASGLYPCLLKAEDYYKINRTTSSCLYTHHMIYSPKVPILKDEEGDLLDDIALTTVITAPAVNAGVVRRNEAQNIKKIEPTMLHRIDLMLAICAHHQHPVLILGAWGCGVFQNDPALIAQQFYELLTTKYKNQFEKVVFSVYSKNPRFITPFEELFD